MASPHCEQTCIQTDKETGLKTLLSHNIINGRYKMTFRLSEGTPFFYDYHESGDDRFLDLIIE